MIKANEAGTALPTFAAILDIGSHFAIASKMLGNVLGWPLFRTLRLAV
jgi:hypothetical protein